MKVLIFIGRAIATFIVANILGFLVNFFHTSAYGLAVILFSKYGVILGLFDFALYPFALYILWKVLLALKKIVKGNIVMAILSTLVFIHCAAASFRILFTRPMEPIIDVIGLGAGYYIGSTITFSLIVICYIIGTISVFKKNDIEEF